MFSLSQAWDKEKIPDMNQTHDLPYEHWTGALTPELLGDLWRGQIKDGAS